MATFRENSSPSSIVSGEFGEQVMVDPLPPESPADQDCREALFWSLNGAGVGGTIPPMPDNFVFDFPISNLNKLSFGALSGTANILWRS